ncbi:quino protein amine dehydrogenase beta chain-like protein [Trichoderma citrinoviride]|uniref:Quino protein amine dehydrogenase beta chain-like protein n=1 Tax=Trichoderma citrinoviride TaxID=58853 RepID=A0A2T4B201_9HYPO|nr:quino protein amine dehydrogenase beta chain-like protein [Trichoderma citrinoviride]PTB63355.1 quino protein amine dehydrogenase beta chain-like protein [Trichoderma citrinoviride]
MHSNIFLTFTALVASATGAVLDTRNGYPQPSQEDPRLVYQFANGTTIENVAVRSNGNLLLTLTDRPELYEVNPFIPKSAKLIHHFPDYLGLLGITEVSPDVFTLNAGNFSVTEGPTKGSFAVWQVAFHKDQPNVSKVADIPEALSLNGMTTLPSSPNTILTADSTAGLVYSVNTRTGSYKVVLDDETFKPAADAELPIGINGIRFLDHYVYYTNSFKALFGRVRVNKSGFATGSYETIATGILGDDFALTPEAAYIAGNPTNTVTEVDLSTGENEVIAGNLNSSLVAGDTSVAFGRTKKDKHVLYVVTTGGSLSPVNGTFSEGGKIVALDI